MESLEDALRQARSGRPQLVLVHAREGRPTAWPTVRLRPGDHRVQVPSLAWEHGSALAVLRRALHMLGAQPDADPAARLRAAAEAVAPWPAVCVVHVENAQWTDEQSLQTFASAVHASGSESGLVVVLGLMPGAYTGLVADDARALAPTAVAHSRGLRPADVLELTPAGREPVSLRLASRLIAYTGGDPVAVSALLHSGADDEDLDADVVPMSVLGRVSGALDDLDPSVRPLLEAVAVLGATTLSEAAAVTRAAHPQWSVGTRSPASWLDHLGESGLVRVRRRSADVHLSIVSDLMAAAVIQLQPWAERDRWHRAAAVAGPQQRRLLHLAAGTLTHDDRLAKELEAQAMALGQNGEWQVAAEHLEAAAGVAEQPDVAHRLLVAAGDAAVGAGDLARAAAIARRLPSWPPDAARDAMLGYLAISQGRGADAERLLQRAWGACARGEESELVATISQRAALHALASWDLDLLVARAERAIARAPYDAPARFEAEAFLGIGYAGQGRHDEALAQCLAAVEEAGASPSRQRALLGLGWVHLIAENHVEASDALRLASAPTGLQGSHRVTLWAQGWLARVHLAQGAFDLALECVARGVDLLERTGLEMLRPLLHWTGAEVHALRGEWERAERFADGALVDEGSYLMQRVPSVLAQAAVARATGDHARVVALLSPLSTDARLTGVQAPMLASWRPAYVRALVATGRPDTAHDVVADWDSAAASAPHDAAWSQMAVAKATVLEAQGRHDEMWTLLDQARMALEGRDVPLQRAHLHLVRGLALAADSRPEAAAEELHLAKGGFRALGAVPLVEQCERALDAAHERP